MGKKQGKYKLQNVVPMENVLKSICNAPVTVLLKIGHVVAPTDYAVKFYYNKQHSMFYKNKEKLRKVIIRAFAMGAFNHREQTILMLYQADRLELTQTQFSCLCEKLFISVG